MSRIWSWLGANLGRRPGVVSAAGLGITLVLGLGITRLDLGGGESSFVEGEVLADSVDYQDRFGGQAMATLYTMDEGHDVVDLFAPTTMAQMRDLETRLRAVDGVRGVVGPLTVMGFTETLLQSPNGDPTSSVAGQALLSAQQRETDPAKAQLRLDSAMGTLGRLNAIPAEQRTLDNPDWVRFLLYDDQGQVRNAMRGVFPDESHALMVTRLDGNMPPEQQGKVGAAIAEQVDRTALEHTTPLTTGGPELLKEVNDYIQIGMLTLGGLGMAVMGVILLVLFDVRWRLLPLAVVLVGLIWAFGVAGYLGIPLSLVTISALPMLLGIGIEFAVQMHARIEEEAVVDRMAEPVEEAGRHLGPALVAATGVGVVAFAALAFSEMPMIRDFGLLLAVGVVAVCLCSILLPMSVLGAREHRSRTESREFRPGPLGRLAVRLGGLPARAGAALAAVAVVVFAAGLPADADLTVQTDPQRWVDQDSAVIRKLGALRETTGVTSELGVMVEASDPFADETVAYVQQVAQEQMAAHPEVLLGASSLVTSLSALLDVPGATPLPPRGQDVAAAYAVAPPDFQAATVDPVSGTHNLILATGPAPAAARAAAVREIGAQLDPPAGIATRVSGTAAISAALQRNVTSYRVLITVLAIGFIALFLALRLRGIIRAALALVPILFAVGLSWLAAWALNIELSPMTSIAGPLVAGACGGFTALMMLRYLGERQAGLDSPDAVVRMASHTGRAFVVSACTAAAGVGVVALSPMPVLRSFGLVVAVDVALALLSALVVLPPVLRWADQWGWVYNPTESVITDPLPPPGMTTIPS